MARDPHDLGALYARLPPCERGADADARGRRYTDYRTATYAVRAIEMLRAQPRPWLLAVGFVRPHLPFNAPAPYWDDARAGPAPRLTRLPRGASALSAAHLSSGDGELLQFNIRAAPVAEGAPALIGENKAVELRRAYAACVTFVDEQAQQQQQQQQQQLSSRSSMSRRGNNSSSSNNSCRHVCR